jgi:hypothetical protein
MAQHAIRSFFRIPGLSLAPRLLVAVAAFAITYAAEAREPETFATPEKAAKALVAADSAGDEALLLAVLGDGAKDLVSSGDPVSDQRGREKFAKAYAEHHAWESRGAGGKTLVVGRDAWPLPIPLVREKGNWHFDAAAGRAEVLQRRIGRNERKTIEVCRAYVTAQQEYAAQGAAEGTLRKYAGESDEQYRAAVRRAAKAPEYAQKFLSAPGKRDGLFWPVRAGEKESPLGPLVAEAEDEGYMTADAKPVRPHAAFHGYHYKILKSQGPAAAGGARDYLERGRMSRGFALLAYPASYGDSGVKTFMIDQAGIVFEKDLGPGTEKLASQIKSYNPDAGWSMATAPAVAGK